MKYSMHLLLTLATTPTPTPAAEADAPTSRALSEVIADALQALR